MTGFLKRALKEAVVLIALAAVAGFGANAIRPDGLALTRSAEEAAIAPGIGAVGLDEALSLYKEGRALFVDARDRDFFEFERIKGAVSLPFEAFDEAFPEVEKRIREARLVLTYCDGKNCPLAEKLAQRLEAAGITRVRVFSGGLEEWAGAGGPVEGGESGG